MQINKIVIVIIVMFIANINKSIGQELVIDEMYRIQMLIQIENYESAIEFTKKLNDNLFCEKNEILGYSYRKLEKYDFAVKYYKAYIDNCNPSYIHRINLGDSYFKVDSLDLAEEQFKEVLKSTPKFALAFYNLGQIEYRRGNREKAAEYFLQAINNTGSTLDFDYVEMMIKTLNDLKKYENAFIIADQVISMWDEDTDEYKYSLILKSTIHGEMGNYQKALEELDSIIASKIENPIILAEAFIYKLDYYNRLDNLEKLCEEYKQLKKVDPNSVWLKKFDCD